MIEIITKKITVKEPVLGAEGKFAWFTREVEWLIYHFEGDVNTFFKKSQILKKHKNVYQRENNLCYSLALRLKLFAKIFQTRV